MVDALCYFLPLQSRLSCDKEDVENAEYNPDLRAENDPFTLTVDAGRSIVGVVNTAWDVGLLTLISPLASMLGPGSSIYPHVYTVDAAKHILHSSIFAFIWEDAPKRARAKYSVVFSIKTSAPYQALALSYMLLRFSEQYTRDGDYQRFLLVDLTYRFTPDGIFGVMMYDQGLKGAVEFVQQQAADNNTTTYGYYGSAKLPFNVWNHTGAELTDELFVGLELDFFRAEESMLDG